jgi:hypothetical protein
MFRRFVVATALAAVASAAVPANQIVALNELYSSTSGKWWWNSANWGVGDPCTNVWSGILCTAGFVYVACSAVAVTTLMTVVVARVCYYMSPLVLSADHSRALLPRSVGLALPDNNRSGPSTTESLGALTDLA